MLGCGSTPSVSLFVLSLRSLVMRALLGSSRSVGLRIEGRPIEEPASGQTGGGLGGLVVVVTGVFLIGYLPPRD